MKIYKNKSWKKILKTAGRYYKTLTTNKEGKSRKDDIKISKHIKPEKNSKRVLQTGEEIQERMG